MRRPRKLGLLAASTVLAGMVWAVNGCAGPLNLSSPWTWLLGPFLTQPVLPRSLGHVEIDLEEVDNITVADDSDVPLLDDQLDSKKPTFDPSLVDRRPIGDWRVNTSGAVIKVDTPEPRVARTDQTPLASNYAAAMVQAGPSMLASINLIDGKAKQFDDGLYAAIDRAYYSGDPVLGKSVEGHLALIGKLLGKVTSGSAASDYLAAGLSLDSSHPPATTLSAAAREQADRFRANDVQSKPISFYTWDPTLGDCFRVLRFFSQPITDRAIVNELARVLRDDAALLARYRKATSFYAGLTNPLAGLTLADFTVEPPPVMTPMTRVALFPPSTSREVELFRKLFPKGPPPSAQLMKALVVAIRSGAVDLAPNPKSGWYEYQAFALEPMLLPERGEGADHLLLTQAYKKRMLAAFEALLTKRRETHARQSEIFVGSRMARPVPPSIPPIKPRLRVEPNPSYYLRTARSYDFVAHLLEATFSAPVLDSIHGLRQSGPRLDGLGPELRSMRDLFLGLYLLSSEDIGHRSDLTAAESGRLEAAESAATAWLGRLAESPEADLDLAADTRVAVPISLDPRTNKVRLWATIGVSLSRLTAEYVQPPQIRPLSGGDWRTVQPRELRSSDHLVAVDEFAEVELDGGRVFTREELRAICDTHKTKDAIRQALGALK